MFILSDSRSYAFVFQLIPIIPAKTLPFLILLHSLGEALSTNPPKTASHTIVNLVCHLGSSTYELDGLSSEVYNGRRVPGTYLYGSRFSGMGGGTPTSAIGLVVLCSLAEEEEGKYTRDWSSCGPKVELGCSLELVLPGCRSDNHRTSLNAIRL